MSLRLNRVRISRKLILRKVRYSSQQNIHVFEVASLEQLDSTNCTFESSCKISEEVDKRTANLVSISSCQRRRQFSAICMNRFTAVLAFSNTESTRVETNFLAIKSRPCQVSWLKLHDFRDTIPRVQPVFFPCICQSSKWRMLPTTILKE